MSQRTPTAVTNFRWLVFLLALGFWIDLFFTTDYSTFGWQFRYLTNWGLTANVLVAWFMLRVSLGRSDKTYNSFVSASVVLGAIIAFMYWKLFFIDPKLINGDNILPWYQEYYLHGGTQILMMFDAFFILGAFRRVWATLATSLVIFFSYIAWTEFVVQPMNNLPLGSATSGFPYPFLNDMAQGQRLGFYVTTIASAILFLGIGVAIARALDKIYAKASRNAQ
ncbi:MAG: hypothetical protein GXP05_14905 [Alphaproteobacteria bacterium]|nr:hypothetical protein [Alphaproteobacteria bacterium]